MADNAPRDAGIPDPDEVEHAEDDDNEDDEDDDPQPPEALAEYLNKWRYWYNLIVHRGEDVLPHRPPPYTQDYVTNEVRPAPFPLSTGDTGFCSVLLAIIITVHTCTNNDWLNGGASPPVQWAGRVIARVFLTIGAAVLSTLSFEIEGSFLGKLFHNLTTAIEDWVSRRLIKRFRWGEVDANGEPMRNEDGGFIWLQDITNRREAIRNSLQTVLIVVVDYLFIFLFESGNRLLQLFVNQIVGPVLYFLFAVPVDFIPKLLSRLALPTPGLDDIKGARTLWFEYGVPIVIQFQVLVLLLLLRILLLAKSERLGLQGWRTTDPKMALVWQLIRATAMHLIAYTAYQLVCGIITALKSVLPQGRQYIAFVDGPLVPFLARITPEGRIFAAALLFGFHWLFRTTSMIGVRLARPLWMPYILWQTRFSKDGASMSWPLFVESLEKDMTVLDPSKRALSRVTMTALFGLRSSWPARFRLSGVVEDN